MVMANWTLPSSHIHNPQTRIHHAGKWRRYFCAGHRFADSHAFCTRYDFDGRFPESRKLDLIVNGYAFCPEMVMDIPAAISLGGSSGTASICRRGFQWQRRLGYVGASDAGVDTVGFNRRPCFDYF